MFFVGTLSKHDGNAKENVTWKYKFLFVAQLRDYHNSSKLYNLAKLSSNKISKKNHCRVLTLYLVISRLFAENDKDMYQNLQRMCRVVGRNDASALEKYSAAMTTKQ